MAGVPRQAVGDKAASARRRRRHLGLHLAAIALGLAAAGGSVYGLLEHGVLPGLATADSATDALPPPYFVTIDGADDIQVVATATGRVTDRVRPPDGVEDEDLNRPAVLTAAAGSGNFAEAYAGQGAPTRIYTFGLTSIGRVTSLAPVRGGVVPDLVGSRLAMSADGRKVAIAGSPDRPYGARPVPLIIVIDAATGRHQTWRGGLARPGSQLSILSLAWRSGDSKLMFTAQWCKSLQAEPDSFVCAGGSKDPPTWPVVQVRQLAVPGTGSSLAHSRVLLRFGSRREVLVQAIPGGDANSVLALIVGAKFAVERISLPGAADSQPLATGPARWSVQPDFLSADGSGRYLLIGLDDGATFGWIGLGGIHRLADTNAQLTSAAW